MYLRSPGKISTDIRYLRPLKRANTVLTRPYVYIADNINCGRQGKLSRVTYAKHSDGAKAFGPSIVVTRTS